MDSSTGLLLNLTGNATNPDPWSAVIWNIYDQNHFAFDVIIWMLLAGSIVQYFAIGDFRATTWSSVCSAVFLLIVLTSTVLGFFYYILDPLILEGRAPSGVKDVLASSYLILGASIAICLYMCNDNVTRAANLLDAGVISFFVVYDVRLFYVAVNVGDAFDYAYAFGGLLIITVTLVMRYKAVRFSNILAFTFEYSVIIASCIAYIGFRHDIDVFSFSYVMPTLAESCLGDYACTVIAIIEGVLVGFRLMFIAFDKLCFHGKFSARLRTESERDAAQWAYRPAEDLGPRPFYMGGLPGVPAIPFMP